MPKFLLNRKAFCSIFLNPFLLFLGLTFLACNCQLTWAVLAQLPFSVTPELLPTSFWQCVSYSKSLMETDFAVGELSSMLIVAFWKSLKMYVSVDIQNVIKELLRRHEEPVVWSWSHTAIRLSLHSSNKCHLYTEATHVSLLADIIDACFSGYMYWLNATANVLRVRSNSKNWWWLSDTLNSQGPWQYGRMFFVGLTKQYIRHHGDNIQKCAHLPHLFL